MINPMIDTHSHLYAEEFDEDSSAVIERAMAAGVERVFLPAIDSSTHERMMRLAKAHAGYCLPMMGLHPCYVNQDYEKELSVVEDWLGREKFYAIGEIGLDYYHSTEFKVQQIDAFARQISLALDHDLPIVIHSRSSMDECIEMIAEYGKGRIKGIFHCFGGDLRQGRRIIELGFVLGIGGVITYKNAGLAKVVEELPLEALVLETDAPYLSPMPFRGKRNETAYIGYVAEKIAEVKGISVDEVKQMTRATAKKIFEC
jgi:TatD DNase family protein